MVPVFFFFVFDPKVVDNESESDVAGLVFEETGGVGALVVPVINEVEDEFVLGDASGVGEAIHALPDGHHGAAVAKFDVVLHFGRKGYVLFEDIHEFGFLHGGSEVVVLDVASAPVGVFRYNGIEEAFEAFHGSGCGRTFTGEFYSVSTYSAPDASLDGPIGSFFLL